ncbi:hypothetical protein [Falsiroseomonas selenitidurans]|uniref:Uncharacterized protein n=1 Tax=Falsiroseomonas selenitidurans TaxID=2716335 RepID=A0ABX1E3L6_9PROT|nr:hypothetical protein [Falsiroseomonas selenitidurans]NKC31676.1 hypothetical protein [Falsiroseomonas selenitidurans]
MNTEQFTRLLDTHGTEPDRWPAAQRAAALALCAVSPAAHGQWMAAKRLDALLAAARAPVPDASRQARIVAGAVARLRARSETVRDWRWLFTRPIGAAFAASLVAGWLVGLELAESASADLVLADLRFEDLFL